MCQSVKLEWMNAWTIPASEEPSTFIAPSSLSTHSVVSGRQPLYEREVGVLAEVSVTEQVLREISKFPEILGKLSMRKQCVPGSFLPAHAREPGNEDRSCDAWI